MFIQCKYTHCSLFYFVIILKVNLDYVVNVCMVLMPVYNLSVTMCLVSDLVHTAGICACSMHAANTFVLYTKI